MGIGITLINATEQVLMKLMASKFISSAQRISSVKMKRQSVLLHDKLAQISPTITILMAKLLLMPRVSWLRSANHMGGNQQFFDQMHTKS